MLIRKLQNSWVHCHESDFDCQWHGDKRDSEKETRDMAARCTRGCTNAKGRSVVFTEVTVLLAWCNSEFRNRDEASPKSVPLRQQLRI